MVRRKLLLPVEPAIILMLNADDWLQNEVHGHGRTVEEQRAAAADKLVPDDLVGDFLRYEFEDWPTLSLNWDTSSSSQRFSLDNRIEREFRAFYPDGFLLAHARVSDLDNVLPRNHKFSADELWVEGYGDKIARLIAFISLGFAPSPPFVAPNEADGGLLALKGGMHRYAVAKKLGLVEVPLHIEPHQRRRIEKLLPLL